MPSLPKPGIYTNTPSARSVNPAESCNPPSVIFRQTPSGPARLSSVFILTPLFVCPGKVYSIIDLRYTLGIDCDQPLVVYPSRWPPKYQPLPRSGTFIPAPSADRCTGIFASAEFSPDEVFGDLCSIHDDEGMLYSHRLKSTGSVAGLSENSPPYRKSELKEFHR